MRQQKMADSSQLNTWLSKWTSKNREEKLRAKVDKKYASELLQWMKHHYNAAHGFDSDFKSDYISELYVSSDFDDEQIFQQLQLQNEAAKRSILENFSLTSIEEKSVRFVSGKSSKKVPENEKVSSKSQKTKDDDIEDSSAHESDGDSETDEELAQIKERIASKADDDFDFDEGSDTLFGGAGLDDEDEEMDDDNADGEDDEEKVEQSVKSSSRKRKSEVDDKFFKLAEMEEFLEQEDRKEERKHKKMKDDDKEAESSESEEDENEDIDMFAEHPDEHEDSAKDFMYGDFFDPPSDGDQSSRKITDETEAASGEEEESGESGDDEEDEGEDESETEQPGNEGKVGKKKVTFKEHTIAATEQKGEQQLLSNFQNRSERLLRQIQGLEEESLAAKTWQVQGEVGASARPENSILEEYLDFDQKNPEASEAVEEVSQSIEEILIQRIKDKAFDDNERQVRPREEAYELVTKRNLDHEKSKLSLHEVYEQEYLNMQAPEEEKTNPLHDEIKKMMASLFPRLDALASWHYTPTQAVSDIKIKSKLPAIQMEEATPITMTSSDVLAPEEVKTKQKGDVKGATERSKEDKRRLRRKSKAAKREKAKQKEKHQKEVEKLNPGLGNKYSKERALKELKKQSAGTVEVLKEKKSKKSMSSKTFFTQLQEEVTSQIKAKTKKTKEKKKEKSSEKFLL